MQPKSSSGSAGRKAKGRRIGALAALGCLVGAIGYAGFALLTRQAAEPWERAEQAALDAAIARIDAESRGDPAAAPSSPKLPAEAKAGASGNAAANTAPAAPDPPEGYSFIRVETEMAKAPMPEDAVGAPTSIDDGLDWLGAPDALPTLVRQAGAAGRDWSFGWVRAAQDAGPDAAKASLDDFGVQVLGASGSLVRAKLPGDLATLRAISALPEVAGLGAVPKERKIAAAFAEEALAAPAYERTPVFITLMTDDPQGRWRRKLEELGAVVGRFDPDIRAYAAHIANLALDAIVSQDFVLAVEPIGVVRAAHDTAVPAMGADALRRLEDSPGQFSGTAGASVPIAVMDTGLNINHLDIATNRGSICGANFYSEGGRVEDADLWVDDAGHGTHVTGTVVGNGFVEPRYAGMAPGVQHIRFAKVLGIWGFGTFDAIARGMDFLAKPSSCAEAGWSAARVKPLIVNMSLSASARLFEGRGVDERKLDSIVWSHRQLYVVAQSNEDIHGFSNYSTAKNSLSVGAVYDSGDLAPFSSHGPTADGRLAPQVVATGVDVYSAEGGGRRGSYISLNGTSMASPSVAGVAALLMDSAEAYRERPALTRARLMASAIKPDAWPEAPRGFPPNNSNGPGALQAQYGLGKVSARTSVLNRNDADGWLSGGAVSTISDGEHYHHDLEVPENTSRLDLVMTWDEPPTDTIGHAVLHDLDLWMDWNGDCTTAACGEHSSTSRKDNVEWIIVRNPPPGTHRMKIVPRRIHGAAPRAALAWTLIRGPSTPQLSLQANKSRLDGPGPQKLTLTLTTDGYVAVGTRLHVACDAENATYCEGVRIAQASAAREDGVADAPLEIKLGEAVSLGEIGVGERQEVNLAVQRPMQPGCLYFTANSWNAAAAGLALCNPGSGEAEPPPAAEAPANDNFGAAIQLQATSGTLPLDLRLATPEPGEPMFTTVFGRPIGSVWYDWTAPATELAQFNVQAERTNDDASKIHIDVFQGDQLADLQPVARAKPAGASFFADKDETYRVRVSHQETGLPLALHWSQGPRPENDDFRSAMPLNGAKGTVEGSNQGASLELGELFDALAATTWHRWTAPRDGVWQFSSNHDESLVLAFTGTAVADARLVSGQPSQSAKFPVRAGAEYRIAVAARNAFAGGRDYRLTWSESNWPTNRQPDNDDFADAEGIEGASSSINISISDSATVEPGEPAATGVRTRWWVWTAPEDGRYTWRLQGSVATHLHVTAFTSPTDRGAVNLADLQLVGATGPHVTAIEFAFDAIAGQHYWIAGGLPTGDLAAFNDNAGYANSADLAWGRTPDNDSLANAAALAGTSGSIDGTNQYATIERGERVGRQGHSSLWWTWEAPAAGWYRFWVVDDSTFTTLSAYQAGGDGFGGLRLVAAPHPGWPDESGVGLPFGLFDLGEAPEEILFYADPGVRFWLRLGTPINADGAEFTLHWAPADPPVWLKYVGRLGQARLGIEQENVPIGGLAFDDLGTTLYMQSPLGLHVLKREPETGELRPVRIVATGFTGKALIWDRHRAKLYAEGDCGIWHRFTPVDDNRRELRSEPLTLTGAGANCGAATFMDPAGEFLYSINPGEGIGVFAFDSADELRHVQFFELGGLVQALLSNSGEYVHAAAWGGLFVLKRNAATGELTQISTTPSHTAIDTFSVSDDERFLFTFSSYADTMLFQLSGDPVNAQFLRIVPHLEFPWYDFGNLHPQCNFSSIRNGRPAADVFCRNMAFSVEYRPPAEGTEERGELESTDYISHWQPDRFNNHIPKFTQPKSMASSPDGKHAYILTDVNELLFFERVGNQALDAAPSADEPGLVAGVTETDI